MNGKKTFSCILCLILILTVLAFPTSLAYEAHTAELDYSKPGSYFNVTLTSSDIIELLGEELTDGERAYLDAYGGLSLSYESVTSQQVTVITADGVTEVHARPYTYTTGRGSTATWSPSRVTIDGISGELVLEDGVYVARFDASGITDESMLCVEYVLDVTFLIAREDINELLNMAYSNAPAIKASIDEARSDYEEKRNAYDSFYAENSAAVDKYYSDKELYAQYLREKLVYDEEKASYLEYLDRYSEYEAQLDLYNAYLAELDEYNAVLDNNLNYEDNYAKYLADMEIYDRYLANKALVSQQISTLDSGLFDKVTSLNRQLYSSLFSSLVDEVIAANKDIYVNVLGIDAKVIDDCEEASATVRAILAPEGGVAYKSLKSEVEKYEFYVNNHAAFRDAIVKLTRSLHTLYSNSRLRDMMHAAPTLVGRPDYTEKLSIFISQLILFSNALSDEPVRDFTDSFVLDGTTTLSYWDQDGNKIKDRAVTDILGGEYVEDSGNASPIPGGYPSEMQEPTPPELLPVPDKPASVARPIEPDPVADPGEPPTVVAEPTPPVGYVENPERPTVLDDEALLKLVSDYSLGNLHEREEVTEDLRYTPTVNLERYVGGAQTVTVTFEDGCGGVISEVTVDKGTSAQFMGDLPTKAEDISATYSFSSWADSDGSIYDLSSVNEDITLYPSFTPNYKSYDLNAAGTRINVSVPHEQLTYLPLEYFTGLAKDNSVGLTVSASGIVIDLSYGVLMQLEDGGVSYLDVLVDVSELRAYSFELTPMDSHGEPVDLSVGISVALSCPDPAFATDSFLTYVEDGETKYLGKSYSDDAVRFTASTNRSYLLSIRYPINLPTSLKGRVTVPADAIPGETVTVDVELPLGQSVQIYYFLESDSSTKHLIGGMSFTMPSEAINLRATFTELTYTVSFVSDGKEISVGTYKYGETVRIPRDPIKLNDSEYSYTFIGWSPAVSTVTGDVVYTAQFERAELPPEETSFPWFTVIYYSVITLLILGVVTVVLIILDKKGIFSIRVALFSVFRKLARVGVKTETANTPDDSDTSIISEENGSDEQ